MSTNCNHY